MKLPNKTGTVYRLSGKRRRPYIARAYAGKDNQGIRTYNTIGYYETKTEARRALLEYNLNPYNLENDRLTLKDVFTLARNEKAKDLQADTIKNNYDLLFNRFFTSLENEPFKDLRAYHYQAVFDNLGQTRKKSYLAKGRQLLGVIYTYAVLNDIVSTNYAKGVVLRGQKSEGQAFFTEKELAEMIRKMGTVPDLDLAVIMCLTGLRPTELLELKKDTVDLGHGIIRNVGIKTEAGKRKRVPISSIIYPCIEKRCNTSERYLVEEDGKKVPYHHFLHFIYKPALQAAGMPYKSPKACRHTFANITHNLLADKTRQEIIGHADIAVTNDFYTDIEEHKLLKEFQNVERYLAESLTKV